MNYGMCRINKRARLTFRVIYVQIYISSPPPFWLFNNIQSFKPNPISFHLFPIKIGIHRFTMTMLTGIDCQRRSSHSPYILELYIWKKEFTTQVLSDRLVQLSIFRCNKRQTDNVQDCAHLNSQFGESENTNYNFL